MPHTGTPSHLGPTRSDALVAVLRGLAGAVPGVGPALSEIVSVAIPKQRLERAESYLQHLAERLVKLEIDMRVLGTPDGAEITEEGLRLAVEQARRDRVKQIAHAVAYGLSADPASRLERNVVRVVAQLDPEDIRILGEAAASNNWRPWHYGLPPDPNREKGNESAAMAWTETWDRLLAHRLVAFKQSSVELEIPEGARARQVRVRVPAVDRWGTSQGQYHLSELGLRVLVANELIPSELLYREVGR